MSASASGQQRISRREIFEASLSGKQTRPFVPRLRSDPPAYQPIPHNLAEFRVQEGRDVRERRLRRLWVSLPKHPKLQHYESDDGEVAKEYPVANDHCLTKESAQRLEEMYQDELLLRFRRHTAGFLNRNIGWEEFEKYADVKEAGMFLQIKVFHTVY